MRNYEIMYILKSDLEEEARKAEIEALAKIITDNGGKVNATDESMGMRTLAYEINDEKKGYYVVLKVTMGNAAIDEFNRRVRINKKVLRHLITVAQD
jgi:small subunit ribosomal protein S6